jgi:predicted O-linked N-acetylglucosamine transferase (SPINDLY family)
MHLMAELFEHHDRSRFELIAFSFGPIRDDPWRARAIAAFDVFHDIGPLTDVDAAALARKCQIDIAIDLKGHTRDSRPGLFAERVAPLQVNYLGYPGTMGAPFMDYLIADAVIIPPTHEAHYREKVIRLPDCYQPNCRHRDIDPTPVTRATYGLPETAFVFCSFNAIHKVTPSIFSIWLRLLHEVDGSVLWLLANEPRARENLRACAAREGVDPDRLIFASTVPVETHLARLPLADLMLDTFPCNAHTTASDALRMGLPLVTLMGQSFASRVAASLLHAVGLPELITTSLDAYEALAISLGRDREALAKIKSKLRDNLPTAPLFDSLETTRHLESAYLEMVTRHRRGEAPAHFGVLEDGTVQ